jgi:hypothetical protein
LWWLPLMLAWMPQYALALTYFDTPTGKALRPPESLPDDWAEELATQMEAGEGETPHDPRPRMHLVPDREAPSAIVNFGWRFRRR